MKDYIIIYTGGLISPAQTIVKAPNKTMARRLFIGEHIPSVKISSIVEKKEEVSMSRLYVAYGSNLNISQMALRCPDAKIYGTGVLNNWELLFRGSPTNSHATIKRHSGKAVPVLVWSISEADEQQLDRYEGFPVYYYKKDVMVNIDGKKKKAMVYIMNEQRRPGIPSARYVQTIRQGYIDNDLDLEFLEDALELNSIECR